MRDAGVATRENASMSSDNADEKSAHRKPKVS